MPLRKLSYKSIFCDRSRELYIRTDLHPTRDEALHSAHGEIEDSDYDCDDSNCDHSNYRHDEYCSIKVEKINKDIYERINDPEYDEQVLENATNSIFGLFENWLASANIEDREEDELRKKLKSGLKQYKANLFVDESYLQMNVSTDSEYDLDELDTYESD